jgi:hypothetical protein
MVRAVTAAQLGGVIGSRPPDQQRGHIGVHWLDQPRISGRYVPLSAVGEDIRGLRQTPQNCIGVGRKRLLGACQHLFRTRERRVFGALDTPL